MRKRTAQLLREFIHRVLLRETKSDVSLSDLKTGDLVCVFTNPRRPLEVMHYAAAGFTHEVWATFIEADISRLALTLSGNLWGEVLMAHADPSALFAVWQKKP